MLPGLDDVEQRQLFRFFCALANFDPPANMTFEPYRLAFSNRTSGGQLVFTGCDFPAHIEHVFPGSDVDHGQQPGQQQACF